MTDKLSAMRHAGRVNKCAIEWGFNYARPGVTLKSIDEAIEAYIVAAGCRPAFKNYQPEGYPIAFPATACLSVNDVVVHGLPNDYVLRDGDLLTIDVGSECDGWFVDAARSRVIGNSRIAQDLVDATEAILNAQLSVIKDGCSYLELVMAAEKEADARNVIILPQWGGHHIGEEIHMPPFIPNALDRRNSNIRIDIESVRYSQQFLRAGETICLEPVASYGNCDTITDGDQWSVRKKDGNLSAHTERCLLITDNGYELLS